MSKAQERSLSDFETWMMKSGRAKDFEFTIGDDQEYIYGHIAEDFSVWCAAVASMSTASSEQQAAQQDAQIAKLTTAYAELSKMFHDQIVAQQSAWIEWQHGEGAEAAMGWIENGLCGPGHIPDEDAPYGKEAQSWYDANNSDPFPACQCGRPSNIMWMGAGFCSKAHHDAARASNEGNP